MRAGGVAPLGESAKSVNETFAGIGRFKTDRVVSVQRGSRFRIFSTLRCENSGMTFERWFWLKRRAVHREILGTFSLKSLNL